MFEEQIGKIPQICNFDPTNINEGIEHYELLKMLYNFYKELDGWRRESIAMLWDVYGEKIADYIWKCNMDTNDELVSLAECCALSKLDFPKIDPILSNLEIDIKYFLSFISFFTLNNTSKDIVLNSPTREELSSFYSSAMDYLTVIGEHLDSHSIPLSSVI